MSKRSQEKRKARAKEKAAQLRKQRHGGVLSRLVGGIEGKGVECWIHEGSQGLISVFAFRAVYGAGTVAGVFLIDEMCLGVKDAYILRNVVRQEIIASARRGLSSAGELRRVLAEEARALVAGAVRWTRDEGFRMPEGTANALKVLGGAMDFENADVSGFGTEDGGLHYIGREEDLENALQDETLEEFLEREDVECEFTDAGWDMLDRTSGVGELDDLGKEEMDETEVAGISRMMSAIRWMNEDLIKSVTEYLAGAGKEVPTMLAEASVLRSAAVLEFAGKGAQGGRERVEQIAARMISEEQDLTTRAGLGGGYRAILEYFDSQPEGSNPLEAAMARLKESATNHAGDVVGNAAKEIGDRMHAAIKEWCSATGQAPHPDLSMAIKLHFAGAAVGVHEGDVTLAKQAANERVEGLLSLQAPERQAVLREAFEQVRAFLSSFESPEARERALGLEVGAESEAW